MSSAIRPLLPGEPAPWFSAVAANQPQFTFQQTAGNFVALVFLGGGDAPDARAFVENLRSAGQTIDSKCARYAVVTDATKFDDPSLQAAFPGPRIIHDPGGEIGKLFIPAERNPGAGPDIVAQIWYVLDPALRVVAAGPLDMADRFIAFVRTLPPPERHAGPGISLSAPVLAVPRVLEPGFCRLLIDAYHAGNPSATGFMRTVEGRTVVIEDANFKRRQDVVFHDPRLREGLRQRLARRLVPEIKKAFQYDVTRIERFIVACYDSQSQGFFKPHRDNTTAGTAHRRFAVTINLNAEEFEGGDLRFPEFGARTYRAPTGGAVVFSCSLLHEATPVTKGARYATLPFLYDDAAAEVRRRNAHLLDNGSASLMEADGDETSEISG
jgi:predicted 2-oxoglutarate/Fe(II)-dependent dioxygenase YbiX